MKKFIYFLSAVCIVIMTFAFTASAYASVSVSDFKLPSVMVKGDACTAQGRVSSTYRISAIRMGIYSEDGKWVEGHNVSKKPGTLTYSLSEVNDLVRFETLPSGTYMYRVYVKDSRGNAYTPVRKEFKVRAAFRQSSISWSSTVIKGKDSPVSGKISSYYRLKSVKAGITDEKGRWIENTSYSPSGKTFDLSMADADIDFSKLDTGRYYLKVYCTDIKGHKGTAVRKAFEVRNAFEADRVSCSELFVRGEDPDVSGRILSVNTMTKIKAGIYDDSAKKWISYKMYYPLSLSFGLDGVNQHTDFSKLECGEYSFRVYCYDSEGNKGYAVKESFEVAKPFATDNMNYPVTLTTGNDKTLTGTITAVYEIQSVRIGIARNGEWVSSWTFRPKATTFDISSANSRVTFAELDAGTYYYKVTAVDVRGNEQTLINRKFTEVKATFSISENYSYPSVLTEGSSFYLMGNVYSDVPFRYVRVGVCSSSGSWLSGFNVKQELSDTGIFYISKVDSLISFGKLPEGTYYYKVYAVDTAGAYRTVVKKKFRVIRRFSPDLETRTSELSSSMYDAINADDVFLQQTLGRGGCTITSAAMMLRRELILSGVDSSSWKMLTEWNMRADRSMWVYNGGMLNGFTVLGITVKYARFDSNATVAQKTAKLRLLLENHPEGVVIYGNYGGRYHATLLTDCIDGVFYVVDPVYGRKTAIAQSTMYSPSATQKSKISNTYSYWYISK